jgi:glycosyltransferase involved in cell wall biosynthesis
MYNKKISIITASYNYADIIAESIDSILNQTYKDWELVVVDDGSKDNSLEILHQYVADHPNIYLYTHNNNENKGLKETIKLALEKCSGKYVAFLESDDIWEKEYLSKKIDIFEENNDIKLVFNAVNLFGDEKKITEYNKVFMKEIDAINSNYHWPQDVSHHFVAHNIIPTFSCVMVEKQALLECNFDTPIDSNLDWWLWAQISFKHKIYCVNEKLTNWRLHPDSYINSMKTENRIQQLNDFRASLLGLAQNSHSEKYSSILFKATLFKSLHSKIHALESSKQDFIQSVKGKKVYMYGAGAFANEVLDYCGKLDIAGFIDGNASKVGQKIGNYTIFHKNDIVKLAPDLIILSVKEWETCYFELMAYLFENNINIPIITNFFEEIRYKKLLHQDDKTSLEQLFFLI